MKRIGRFQAGTKVFYGKVEDGRVYPVTGDVFGGGRFSSRSHAESDLKVLPPVVPGKVLAVGLNYLDHILEMRLERPREPLFWFKAPSSLLPHGGTIHIAHPSHRTDYEAELAVVIGRPLLNATIEEAQEGIWGYTAAQDISDRTIQKSESQWGRCKSFDTFTPLGPYVVTGLNAESRRLQLYQNGKLMQDSSTGQMLFGPAELVRFISQNLTLLPGDVILTGTPSGVGPIRPGDRLEVRIEGLEPLVNSVR